MERWQQQRLWVWRWSPQLWHAFPGWPSACHSATYQPQAFFSRLLKWSWGTPSSQSWDLEGSFPSKFLFVRFVNSETRHHLSDPGVSKLHPIGLYVATVGQGELCMQPHTRLSTHTQCQGSCFLSNFIAQFSSFNFGDDVLMWLCQKREMPRTLGYLIKVLDFSPDITGYRRRISVRKTTF